MQSKEGIKMKSVGSSSTAQRERKDDVLSTDGHGSEEVLAHDGGHINVTTTINEPDELPGAKPGMYRNRPTLSRSRAA